MTPAKDKAPETDRLICDFVGGAVGHRFRFGGGRGQSLPKAVGMKGGKTPSVVDATAGLGRDAFLLASLGAEVTLIERSAEMHDLLAAGLARAREAGGDIAPVIERMTLLSGMPENCCLTCHLRSCLSIPCIRRAKNLRL